MSADSPSLEQEGRTQAVRPSVPTVTTREELAEVVRLYSGADLFVVDVETVGPHRIDPVRNDVLWIGLGTEGLTHVIPLGHPNGELVELRRPVLPKGIERLQQGKALLKSSVSASDAKARKVFSDPPPQLTPGEVFAALEPLFFDPEKTVIGHHIRFDLRSIAKYYQGRLPTTPMYDTVVGEFLTNDLLQHQLALDKCVKRRLKYEMAKGVGAQVEAHPFWEVARYLYLDVKMTWLLYKNIYSRLDRAKLTHLMALEMDLAQVLMEMEHSGTLIDVDVLTSLKKELEHDVLRATAFAYRLNGGKFNVNSTTDLQRVLFSPPPEGRGLTPKVFTEKKNEPSTSDEALKHHSKDALVGQLLLIREYKKLLSTYVIPYLGGDVERVYSGKVKKEHRDSALVNSRIHTNFKQHGAKTGRLSCVSGDTLLVTSRGTFRFDEYLPVEGDLVRTHTGRWMPVLRKIYKGVEQMYRVRSSEGGSLTCTADHRLLTPVGWVRVGDFAVGDLVVGEQDVCAQPAERAAGVGAVQGGRQADRARLGSASGDDVSQRAAHPQDTLVGGGVRGGEGAAVLTVQGGSEEPYVGQEWFPSSQLHRGHRGRSWVSDAQGGGSLRAGASDRHGGSHRFGSPAAAAQSARASHRRGQEEQRLGQSGAGHPGGAPHVAPHHRVVEITAVGAMGVWDIEVAGDHSYAAGGFLNHNSSQPNLQNIPNPEKSDYGKRIRNAFIADPGCKLVQADWSQVEPRIMASLANDQKMIDAFLSGEDIYTVISDPLDQPRSAGKLLILAMSYGVGPDTIAAGLGISSSKAKQLLRDFETASPELVRLKKRTVEEASRRRPVPYATTVLGRRRFLPDLLSSEFALRGRGERQAFNHLIQGTASDAMKIALIRIHRTLPERSRLLLTVHDEVVVLAPLEEVDEAAQAVKEGMEGVKLPRITVPLQAEVKIVDKWGDAK